MKNTTDDNESKTTSAIDATVNELSKQGAFLQETIDRMLKQLEDIINSINANTHQLLDRILNINDPSNSQLSMLTIEHDIFKKHIDTVVSLYHKSTEVIVHISKQEFNINNNNNGLKFDSTPLFRKIIDQTDNLIQNSQTEFNIMSSKAFDKYLDMIDVSENQMKLMEIAEAVLNKSLDSVHKMHNILLTSLTQIIDSNHHKTNPQLNESNKDVDNVSLSSTYKTVGMLSHKQTASQTNPANAVSTPSSQQATNDNAAKPSM